MQVETAWNFNYLTFIFEVILNSVLKWVDHLVSIDHCHIILFLTTYTMYIHEDFQSLNYSFFRI